MAHNVFVYGSLTNPELVEVLLGKKMIMHPAIVKGYKVYGVQDEWYPAALPHDKSEIKGFVIYGLDETDIDLFDQYESYEYDRICVKAYIKYTQEIVETYIWNGASNKTLKGAWDKDSFRETLLPQLVRALQSRLREAREV